MNERILAVDDDPLTLRTYSRALGGQFNLVTAASGPVALAKLKADEYAVILSDLKMPEMDGVTFLRAARVLRPDAVRVMISGQAELGDAINSLNNAGIFRLVLKPCPCEEISDTLTRALEQYRLITAEKQLLEGTLNGAIQMLTEILSIMDASVYGKAQLRRRLAREVAIMLRQPIWTFEIAALLAEVGRATLPPALNEKLAKRYTLTEQERQLVQRVPEFSSRLLRNIPRIDAVAQAVLYQGKAFNGAGFPLDSVAGKDIPLAGRVLRAVNALIDLVDSGIEPELAINMLKQDQQRYDPDVAIALYPCVPLLLKQEAPPVPVAPGEASMATLAAGMILRADIVTGDGIVVLGSGTRLTELHVQRVKNFAQLNPVAEPILVEMQEA